MKMKNLFFLSIIFFGLLVSGLSAHPSWGIEVDRSRNIYFADLTHNGVGTITNKGRLIPLLRNFHAHNVNLDKDGNPVAAHGGEPWQRLVRIKNGKPETIVSVDDWQKFFGGNAAYSKRGNIFFGTKQIWQYRKGKTTAFNSHKFEWIQSLYVDDEEFAYAVDKGINNGTLYRLSKNGAAEILATGLISKLEKPVDIHDVALLGITKGCDGQMYVTESVGRRVIKINYDKTSETFYESEGDWFPTGVDFFSGDAYILEYKSRGTNRGPRITKIDESGKKTEVFNYDTYKPPTNKKANNYPT